jgi:hypothetical protein
MRIEVTWRYLKAPERTWTLGRPGGFIPELLREAAGQAQTLMEACVDSEAEDRLTGVTLDIREDD